MKCALGESHKGLYLLTFANKSIRKQTKVQRTKTQDGNSLKTRFSNRESLQSMSIKILKLSHSANAEH